MLDNSATFIDGEFTLLDDHSAQNKWIMGLAPRNHAKSSVFTVTYPIWRIGKDPNLRIVICSENASQSQSFLREITTEIEGNDEYHKLFGHLKPDKPEKWTDKEIIVNRTATGIKDPTVSATSMGGSVLSKRADIIICDDVLSYENCRTAERRQKVRDWFMNVLVPVLDPDGQLIVVGTAWNTEDLYHELLGNQSFDVKFVYDAIQDEGSQETLWPERFNYEQLMRIKGIQKDDAFNRSYRNIARSATDQIFRVKWLNEAKSAGKGRKLIRALDYAQWDLGRMVLGAGVDLAISKREDSDECAIAVVGRLRDGRKIPLWLDKGNWSPAQQRSQIKGLHEKFRPTIILVENNAYQDALVRDLAEDNIDLPVRGYTTGGEKFDEEIGINSLAVEFENGRWILPYWTDDAHTTEMIDDLVGGLLDFPNGHTRDIVMALWFASTALRTIATPNKPQAKVEVRRGNVFNRRTR